MRLLKSFTGKHGNVKLFEDNEQFHIEIIDAIYGKTFINHFGGNQLEARRIYKESAKWAENLDALLADISDQFKEF